MYPWGNAEINYLFKFVYFIENTIFTFIFQPVLVLELLGLQDNFFYPELELILAPRCDGFLLNAGSKFPPPVLVASHPTAPFLDEAEGDLPAHGGVTLCSGLSLEANALYKGGRNMGLE